jgi:prophage regulatory protein
MLDSRDQRDLDALVERLRADPGQRTLGQLVQEREQAALMLERLRRALVSPERQSRDDPIERTSQEPQQRATVSKQTYPEGALLRMKNVKELLGVSAGTVYRWISEGTFPRPVRVGERSVRWRLDDLEAWRDGLSANTVSQFATRRQRRASPSR